MFWIEPCVSKSQIRLARGNVRCFVKGQAILSHGSEHEQEHGHQEGSRGKPSDPPMKGWRRRHSCV